jgi:hypothetical protein
MELETQRKTLYMTSKVIFILYCDVNVWTPAGNTDVNIWTPEGSVDAPRFAMASTFSRREYSVYVPPEGRSFTLPVGSLDINILICLCAHFLEGPSPYTIMNKN